MKLISYLTIIIVFLTFSGIAWGNDSNREVATKDAYFDTATGHKYIKNADNTYAEYTRKGKLFRARVANNLPVLVSNRYVFELNSKDYIMYEKMANNKIQQQILSGKSMHPKGWQSKEILLSMNNYTKSGKIGLGYTKAGTIIYDGQQTIVTGKAYFDTATGHKYIKNSDNTYAEYTKKGKLFRARVANNLPVLTSNRNVFDLDPKDYIIYEKMQDGQIAQQILPTSNNHPKDWYSTGVLASGKSFYSTKEMNL